MSPELEQIRREVERVTRDWSDDDWHTAPPNKWTSGHLLEHLRLAFTSTTTGLRNVMDAGRPLGSRANFTQRCKVFVVTKLGFMPARATASASTTPRDGLDTTSMRRFFDALVAMDATLTDVERRFGSRVKLLDHPILGPLTAMQWRRFHRTHALHHLKQLEQRHPAAGTRGGNPSA